MDRTEFIAQALEINLVQASLLSEMIIDIPDEKLKDFLVFRMKYIEPMMSKELITKKALFEYRRLQYESGIKNGSFKFKNTDEVKEFLMTYYKGKEIGNGLGKFYDYVVIGLDQDGNFINKYVVEEFTGKYRKLNSEDVNDVISYLFKNQDKLGSVKHLPYKEEKPKQIAVIVEHGTDNRTYAILKKAAEEVRV